MNDSGKRQGQEDWRIALKQSGFPERVIPGYEIVIRWFLGWYRRQRPALVGGQGEEKGTGAIELWVR